MFGKQNGTMESSYFHFRQTGQLLREWQLTYHDSFCPGIPRASLVSSLVSREDLEIHESLWHRSKICVRWNPTVDFYCQYVYKANYLHLAYYPTSFLDRVWGFAIQQCYLWPVPKVSGVETDAGLCCRLQLKNAVQFKLANCPSLTKNISLDKVPQRR